MKIHPGGGIEEGATLESIKIKTEATKKSFTVGEEFTYDGLTLTAKYTDNHSEEITEGFKVTLPEANYDANGKIRLSTSGHTQTVGATVTYEEKTTSYQVSIKDGAAVDHITLTLSDEEATCSVGGDIDLDATVLAFFGEDDEEGEDVTALAELTYTTGVGDDAKDFDTSEAGTFTVTVTARYEEKTASTTVTVTVEEEEEEPSDEETSDYEAPDLSGYYKKYFVGGGDAAPKFTAGTDTWGSGSEIESNDDGTISLTNGTSWGNVACAAFTGFDAGVLANYEYIVVTLDMSGFELVKGEGNNGVNIKIPDVQKDITDNWKKEADGTRSYYAKVSDFGTDPQDANQFALIVGGEGTLVIKEIYAAAEEDPATKAVTGITISPQTASLEQGGTQQFTVKDSNIVDITDKVTYTLSGDAVTGSEISDEGLLKVGETAGTLTLTATYTVGDDSFTAEADVTVLGELTNLVSSVELEKFLDSKNTTESAVTITDNTVTLVKPADGSWGEWSSQLFLSVSAENGNIFESGKKYYISVTLESDIAIGGVIWKGDDSAGYLLEQGVPLEAGVAKTLVKEVEFTADFEKFQSIFAFGDSGDATITISKFTVYDITE